MELNCRRAALKGDVWVPGSKSHTIRAVAIAALADGESRIERPLASSDAEASVRAYRALGAEIDVTPEIWRVRGVGGQVTAPENIIDVGNSGTTLRVALGSAALLRDGAAVFTGDEQIRRRPCGALAASLTDLGAPVWSTRDNGCAPFVARGRLAGGHTEIGAVTSQFLTSLLLNAPLGDGDSTIEVTELNEQPYVEMTLDWLRRQGVEFIQDDWRAFRIPGGQRYEPVCRAIPADWSSATFFLAAGALPGNAVMLRGLDPEDTQGDKAVLDYLRQMGADVSLDDDGIRVQARDLAGCELDLNATPDALPMMAVLGCFARGTTRLVNVPQARVKETDRIAVMCQELGRLGADIEELEDGLVIHESALRGSDVDGHGDHRVVMALAVAGSAIPGDTAIRGYEAVAVTYPGFVEDLASVGGNVQVI